MQIVLTLWPFYVQKNDHRYPSDRLRYRFVRNGEKVIQNAPTTARIVQSIMAPMYEEFRWY
jgi:hypothetical protein